MMILELVRSYYKFQNEALCVNPKGLNEKIDKIYGQVP